MTTITIINPWSGAIVERDTDSIDTQAVAALLSDDELYELECQCTDTDAEWLQALVDLIGHDRAGHAIIGA